MSMMSSGSGLNNSKLKLATAQESEVLAGETFYSGSKEIKTGSMENNGAWGSTINAGGSVVIPRGFHNGAGTVRASNISNIMYITRSSIADSQGTSLNTTVNGSSNYRALLIFVGQPTSNSPSISISGGSWKQVGVLNLEDRQWNEYSSEDQFWMYLVTNLSSTVNVNITYNRPNYGQRAIIIYGIT